MELNHRLLHVTQVSSPLDHGIVLSVTEVGVEPTRTRPSTSPLCQGLRTRPVKWPVQVSHLAVGAYEAPLGSGPPASFVIAGPGNDPGEPAL